jgi:hypothetical protein
MKKLNFFEYIYKRFIMYKQTLKWYKIVKPATKSHRKIDSCVRFLYQVEEEITAEDESGNVYTFKADELEDATAEYLTKKIEQAALFLAGVTALVILGANVINEGHWIATIGFAIISFVCFTVHKIQKDEY